MNHRCDIKEITLKFCKGKTGMLISCLLIATWTHLVWDHISVVKALFIAIFIGLFFHPYYFVLEALRQHQSSSGKNQCSVPDLLQEQTAYKGMRLLPQRCIKTLQLPSAPSFFISNYGSAISNRASAPLCAGLRCDPPLLSLPGISQSWCKHANKANRLSFQKSFCPWTLFSVSPELCKSARFHGVIVRATGVIKPVWNSWFLDYSLQIRFALSTFNGSSFLLFLSIHLILIKTRLSPCVLCATARCLQLCHEFTTFHLPSL